MRMAMSRTRDEKEPGKCVSFSYQQEFGKFVDWSLTGRVFVERKKASANQNRCRHNHVFVGEELRYQIPVSGPDEQVTRADMTLSFPSSE